MDYPRERTDSIGSVGPVDSVGSFGPDPTEQAFDRFLEASGAPRQQDYDTAELPVRRWRPPRLSGLDVLWLVLASILVVAVVFVVSIARSSMNNVGVPASTGPAALPKPSPTAGTMLILQISSSTSRGTAEATARDLNSHGFEAKVLRSGDFRGLNKGFFVVYTGFYPATADGRAQARRVQSRLPGSLLREVLPR